MNKEIGGYFQIEIPSTNGYLYKNGYQYKSARSAFYSLLISLNVKEIYIPNYICDSMLVPLKVIGTKILWYDIDSCFRPVISDYKGELILYVNYFGICDYNINLISKRFGGRNVIIDNSQSFFSTPDPDVLATIYSPRKFFGIPDGGTIITNENLEYSGDAQVSMDGIKALIKRFEVNAEEGYFHFKESTRKFNEVTRDRVSQITLGMLSLIDYEEKRLIRRTNFNYINSRLKAINLLELEQGKEALCYPLLLANNTSELAKLLIANKVYTPVYWSDALKRLSKDEFARKLVENVIFIPIDHRYDTNDLDYIVELIHKYLD